MRTLPEGFAGPVATLAHLWLFERADGQRFGFTDHDRDLVVDGQLFSAASGLTAARFQKSLGLAVDTAGVEGALTADAITAEDLAAGLWDRARCDVWRCDWSAPERRVHLFAGRLGEVRHGPQGFSAELRGLQSDLNRAVGRVFTRACDAELGDARCGVDLSLPSRRADGVITEVLGDRAFRASGLEGFADGFFAHGRLMWAAGGAGRVAAHRIGAPATLELSAAPAHVLAVGQGFTVTAGCDRALATCRDKFANALNFRGFPHMPGPDAVIAGADAHGRNDGGSRWS